MKIEVHCLLHNEILMLPYFVRHYKQFASRIVFYESNSTDGSPEIAELLGCEVVKVEENDNKVDENIFCRIKNNCWKDSKADWAITSDMDELVYHPDIVGFLKKTDATVIQPREFYMYSWEFPETDGQIYDVVKHGTIGEAGYGKMNLFRPSEVNEMNYNAGCHSCAPEGNIKLLTTQEVKTLHFHFTGYQKMVNRNRYIASRLSDINKQKGWGVHHTWSEEKVRKDFEDAMKKLVRVV